MRVQIFVKEKSESEQLKEAKNQEGLSLLLSGRTAVFNFLTNRQNSSPWNFFFSNHIFSAVIKINFLKP